MAECVAAVTMYNYQDVLYGHMLQSYFEVAYWSIHSQNSVLKRNIGAGQRQTPVKSHGNLFLRLFSCTSQRTLSTWPSEFHECVKSSYRVSEKNQALLMD